MTRSTFDTIKALLRKYLEGSLDSAERQQLDEWLAASPGNRQFFERISDPEQLQEDIRLLFQSKENIFSRLQQQISELAESPVRRLHFLRRSWVRYAAAVIVIAGITTYFYFNRQRGRKEERIIPQNDQISDIAPGSNKATLTLADGSVITLDNASNGNLARQGSTRIVKLDDGQLTYQQQGVSSAQVMINTMRTPRGGQYRLTLPDGTKVWLNAASSITYPAVFVQPNRKVAITGEAYFEVAKDARHPFLVDIDGRSGVEVLGTHFNVNAYRDEAGITTTLIEGRVRVTGSGSGQVVLQPGQQAVSITGHAGIIVNSDVPVERIIAWKNGRFDFNGLELPAVMRQLERWYDITVHFTGPVPHDTYQGRLTRDLSLKQVLGILTNMEVRYRLEGRTLTIY